MAPKKAFGQEYSKSSAKFSGIQGQRWDSVFVRADNGLKERLLLVPYGVCFCARALLWPLTGGWQVSLQAFFDVTVLAWRDGYARQGQICFWIGYLCIWHTSHGTNLAQSFCFLYTSSTIFAKLVAVASKELFAAYEPLLYPFAFPIPYDDPISWLFSSASGGRYWCIYLAS